MRRIATVIAGLALIASGCSSDKDTTATPDSTTSTSTTTTTTAAAAACSGIGTVPEGGEITWVADGKLVSTSGCLVDVGGATTLAGWGGNGDRVAVGNAVVVGASPPVEAFPDGPLVLSRPTGTAVLRITPEGKLLKRDLAGPTTQDISFMARHEAAVYHPAGRSIVSSGTNDEGGAELMIADNRGKDPRRLLTIEDAKRVHNPAFTKSGALLYTADHGDNWDLHRLVIGEETFSTMGSVKAPGVIADVVASPFAVGGVAWTEGRCTATDSPTLQAEQGGKRLSFAGTDAERARPVGWLPDGGLVVIKAQSCQPGSAGTLAVVRDGKLQAVADNVASAAVRAVLPPPPAPPKSIPQQAPA